VVEWWSGGVVEWWTWERFSAGTILFCWRCCRIEDEHEQGEWGMGRQGGDALATTCKVKRYNVVESAILAANEFVY
jgi:hypothetical protein